MPLQAQTEMVRSRHGAKSNIAPAFTAARGELKGPERRFSWLHYRVLLCCTIQSTSDVKFLNFIYLPTLYIKLKKEKEKQ